MNELINKGLTPKEVEESRINNGDNVLTAFKRESLWSKFIGNFDDPVIRILLIAAVIAIGIGFYSGNFIDGVGIIVAILLATFLAAINEYRANKEFEILMKYNEEKQVEAIRDGKVTSIDKKDIVVGDVLVLREGSEIPADGEVISAEYLKVDESSLTGESVPFSKMPRNEVKKIDSERAYKPFELRRSSIVVEGVCVMKVSAVGNNTEIGKILKDVIEEEDVQTPLNKQLEKLSKLIGVVGFSVAFFTFFALFIRNVLTNESFAFSGSQWYFLGVGFVSVMIMLYKVWMPIVYDAIDLLKIEKEVPDDVEKEGVLIWLKYIGIGAGLMLLLLLIPILFGYVENLRGFLPSIIVIDRLIEFFMIAAVLIVVAVPEGLVMSVVLSLSYSMRKMKIENTLVRKLSATETMGAATVICTDKTGTLTENKMTVSGFKTMLPENHPLILESIAVNSTASIDSTKYGDGNKGELIRIGNHTEAAIIDYLYRKYSLDYELFRGGFSIVEKRPFSTEYKYMATCGVSKEHGMMNYLKGAPEVVLNKCSHVYSIDAKPEVLDDIRKQKIQSEIDEYQRKGHRVLSFAMKSDCKEFDTKNFSYLGFVAIADPLRKEVKEAMEWSKAAGIDVKIITGDARLTTQTIAHEADIWNENDSSWLHLSGEEFRNMPDEEVIAKSKFIKIISRAKPEDKKRFVTLLQKANEVVAVTGDGVNDAPALKTADVGLSMGSGTDLAQEASKMVIINDSFFSIMNGVKWGRSLYQNIQRFILFQLTINVATLTIAMLGPFIGLEIPLTAVQLLWINLIMDTFGALALATEAPNPDVMKEKPRNPDSFILSKEMTKNIFIDSFVFVGILLFYLFYSGLNKPASLAPDELIYKESIFFTLFVLLNFWNLFNAKVFGMKKSVFKDFFDNKGFLIIAITIFVGQILMIQFGGEFFRTIPLVLKDWLFVIGLTSLVLWFGEVRRLFKR